VRGVFAADVRIRMAKRCGAKRLGEEESTIVKKIRDKKMGRGRNCWQKDVGQKNWEFADS
jgi:hypothetical protein